MTVGVSDPAVIAKMIGEAQLAGAGHLAALLRPTMRGEMNLIVPQRDTPMLPLRRL